MSQCHAAPSRYSYRVTCVGLVAIRSFWDTAVTTYLWKWSVRSSWFFFAQRTGKHRSALVSGAAGMGPPGLHSDS
ncbi:hypothetical protein ACFQV2_20040 [Actinokineospora soli]|uniref:Uncharacterized protein n=1 Tax=Actinokineospora soli TaxID=1048753 RepID=A0ABW2TPY9_9PSEU